MPTLYRVITPYGASLGEGNSIDEIVEIVKQAQPGLSRRPDPDRVRRRHRLNRTLGEVIKTMGGRIKLDARPWAD